MLRGGTGWGCALGPHRPASAPRGSPASSRRGPPAETPRLQPGRWPAPCPGARRLTSAFALGPPGLVVRLLGPGGGRLGALGPRRLLLAPLAPQPVEGAAEAGAGLLPARGAAGAPRLLGRRCGGGRAGRHARRADLAAGSGPLRPGAHAGGGRAGGCRGRRAGRKVWAAEAEPARSGRCGRRGRREGPAGGGRGAGTARGQEPGRERPRGGSGAACCSSPPPGPRGSRLEEGEVERPGTAARAPGVARTARDREGGAAGRVRGGGSEDPSRRGRAGVRGSLEGGARGGGRMGVAQGRRGDMLGWT